MGVTIWIVLALLSVLPSLQCKKKVCLEVQGIIAPVFTPIDDDNRVQLEIVLQYAQFLADHGVDGVMVAGTAGEGPSLNVTEKKNLIDAWMEAAKPRKLTVTLQVGGIPLPDAQELAAYAEQAHVDAILTLPELFFRPRTVEELVFNIQEVAKAAPETPILYYHTPVNSGVNVDVDMVEFFQLATSTIPNFKGLKSGDFGTALELQDLVKDDQKIFVADSLYLAAAVFSDFEDILIQETNLFPTLVKNIVRYGKSCKYKKWAKSQYRKLRDLRAIIIEEGNQLAAYKEAMPLVTGVNVGPVRPPEIKLTTEQVLRLEERLKKNEIDIIDSVLDG